MVRLVLREKEKKTAGPISDGASRIFQNCSFCFSRPTGGTAQPVASLRWTHRFVNKQENVGVD